MVTKRIFTLFLLLSLTSFSIAQKNKIDKKTNQRIGEWKIYMKEFAESSESDFDLIEYVQYENGDKQGQFMWQKIDNGTLFKFAEGNYQKGEIHGEVMYYQSNGRPFAQETFNNGKRERKVSIGYDGVATEVLYYDNNNNVFKKVVFKGPYNGVTQNDYPIIDYVYTDKLKDYYAYSKDHMWLDFTAEKKDSTWEFHEFATDRYTGDYWLDKIYFKDLKTGYDGLYTKYDKTGNKEFSCHYLDGVLDGNYIEYYPQGQVLSSVNFKDGSFHGAGKLYYPDSSVAAVMTFRNGLLDGEVFTYLHPESSLAVIFQENQIKTNKISELLAMEKSSMFGKTGKYHLLQKAEYVHGKLVGEYFIFWPDNSFWAKAYFKDGKMVNYEKYNTTGEIIKSSLKDRELAAQIKAQQEEFCNRMSKCSWCSKTGKYCDQIHYNGDFDCWGNQSIWNPGITYHFCSRKCKHEFTMDQCKDL